MYHVIGLKKTRYCEKNSECRGLLGRVMTDSKDQLTLKIELHHQTAGVSKTLF